MTSLYDSIASEPNGLRRIAAAEARQDVLSLLHAAHEHSGLRKNELAERLGLRKSAVSAVFGGNGNVRINTLSDYLFESGLELKVTATPRTPPPQRPGRDYRDSTMMLMPLMFGFPDAGQYEVRRHRASHDAGHLLLKVDVSDMGYQDLAEEAVEAETGVETSELAGV